MQIFVMALKIIKKILGDWFDDGDPHVRQLVLEWMTRDLPGRAGFVLRREVLAPRIKSDCLNLDVFPGVYLLYKRNLTLGDNVRIAYRTIIDAQGGIEIGSNTLIGHYVSIWSQNHNFASCNIPIIEQGMEQIPVRIGANVWIGAHSFIMPGTDLGDYSIVSAGSVVAGKKYPPYSILAGNPARRIGSRN